MKQLMKVYTLALIPAILVAIVITWRMFENRLHNTDEYSDDITIPLVKLNTKRRMIISEETV